MAHRLKASLADQIRDLRGNRSQKEFGALIGKPQSVVSRLEKEDYGKVTLQTLIDIATRLDIGLVVQFVDFSTFLRTADDRPAAPSEPRANGATDRTPEPPESQVVAEQGCEVHKVIPTRPERQP